MKLCTDCKHSRYSRFCGWGCAANAMTSPVDGRETVHVLCETHRLATGQCGPEGKLFEPKPLKWWDRKITVRFGGRD